MGDIVVYSWEILTEMWYKYKRNSSTLSKAQWSTLIFFMFGVTWKQNEYFPVFLEGICLKSNLSKTNINPQKNSHTSPKTY